MRKRHKMPLELVFVNFFLQLATKHLIVELVIPDKVSAVYCIQATQETLAFPCAAVHCVQAFDRPLVIEAPVAHARCPQRISGHLPLPVLIQQSRKVSAGVGEAARCSLAMPDQQDSACFHSECPSLNCPHCYLLDRLLATGSALGYDCAH